MENQEIYLIGFRINPENREPEVYTILIFGETNRPILMNGHIVFFAKPELARLAIEISEPSLLQSISIPKDVELVVDIAETLYLISSEKIDPEATIINCLNIFVDLIKPLNISMPSLYKNKLNDLASHLTFEREFSDFLIQKQIDRSLITDAILWIIGVIVSKSKLIQ